ERGPRGAGEPHMGEELQRIPVRPVGVGELEEVAALGGARIVDQDVDAAECALSRRDQRGRRLVLAQVERLVPGGTAELPHPPAPTPSASAFSARPVSITSQPSCASVSAMPRPMPRLDPVTSATLPVNPRSILSLTRYRASTSRSGGIGTCSTHALARVLDGE